VLAEARKYRAALRRQGLWPLRRATPYLLLAPAFFFLTAITVYPLIWNLVLALLKWDLIAPQMRAFGGLANFHELLLGRTVPFWESLRFTLVFMAATVALAVVFGLATALLVRPIRRGRTVLVALLLLPYMVAPIAVGLGWRLMWAREYGIVNSLLRSVGLPEVSWLADPTAAVWAVIITEVWRSSPFAMLIFLAGLAALPVEVFEAARIDGASLWQETRYVTIPLLLPSLTVVMLFQTILKLRVFDLIFSLTGGGPGTTTTPLGLLLYRTSFRYFDGGLAAALAVITLVLGAGLAYLYLRAVPLQEGAT
jgi:multiple sugar transport system permease protein